MSWRPPRYKGRRHFRTQISSRRHSSSNGEFATLPVRKPSTFVTLMILTILLLGLVWLVW